MIRRTTVVFCIRLSLRFKEYWNPVLQFCIILQEFEFICATKCVACDICQDLHSASEWFSSRFPLCSICGLQSVKCELP